MDMINLKLNHGSLRNPSANPRRMRSEGYGSWVCLSVCVYVLTSFIRPTNDTTYLTGNEGQTVCAVFSENAPLQS